jgi:hypothetical protein
LDLLTFANPDIVCSLFSNRTDVVNDRHRMKRKIQLSVWLPLALPIVAAAQIPYDGGTYTQDFNGLESGVIYRRYDTFPAGWDITAQFSSSSYVWTTVTNGYSNNYGAYCFSSSSNDVDKSIGLVIGSTGQAYLGARLRNVSSRELTAFSLSYTVKQWAKGAVTGTDQVIPFAYSLDATNLRSGTFVRVAALDMHSVKDGDGIYSALNGNDAANEQSVGGTVSGITWLPNRDLWIRWSGVSRLPFESNHALAIDDFTFRAVPLLQIASVGLAQYRLSWSTNYPGFILQAAPTTTPTEWETVGISPIVSGSDYRVEINRADKSRFFRLVMP